MGTWEHKVTILCVLENASDVAEQLKAFTNNKLTDDQVSAGVCDLSEDPGIRTATDCRPSSPSSGVQSGVEGGAAGERS